MRRDRNGRFSKASDEGLNVSFNIPSLKTIIYWIVFRIMDISKENKNSRTKEIISTVAYIVAVVFIVFLMPWIIIVQRSDAFGTLFNIFEDLMGVNSNDSTEQPKKKWKCGSIKKEWTILLNGV